MKIFIGGSKTIGRLSDEIRVAITELCRQEHHILIGDCYGVDLAVQVFLAEIGYPNITVYTSCEKARNNIGPWPEKTIRTDEKGYHAHRQKDKAMTAECDRAVMIWDGKTKGTLANINDVEKIGKPLSVYRIAANEQKA